MLFTSITGLESDVLLVKASTEQTYCFPRSQFRHYTFLLRGPLIKKDASDFSGNQIKTEWHHLFFFFVVNPLNENIFSWTLKIQSEENYEL